MRSGLGLGHSLTESRNTSAQESENASMYILCFDLISDLFVLQLKAVLCVCSVADRLIRPGNRHTEEGNGKKDETCRRCQQRYAPWVSSLRFWIWQFSGIQSVYECIHPFSMAQFPRPFLGTTPTFWVPPYREEALQNRATSCRAISNIAYYYYYSRYMLCHNDPIMYLFGSTLNKGFQTDLLICKYMDFLSLQREPSFVIHTLPYRAKQRGQVVGLRRGTGTGPGPFCSFYFNVVQFSMATSREHTSNA